MPWQVIVRFSPSLNVAGLTDAKPFPKMYIDRPNLQLAEASGELPKVADDDLINEVLASDVVLCGPSSIVMDAMTMGKPVVILALHRSPKSYLEGVYYRYDYDHFKFLLDCGAARMAKTVDELKLHIETYMKNPSFDEEGRKKFLDAYAGLRDGQSGRRAASVIKSLLFIEK